MTEGQQEKPKIIVDDDWKAQAQAEKERLSQKVEKEAAEGPRERELPPADFAGLVNSLVSNILFALGGFEDPNTKRRYLDIPLARHYIDLLAVLEEKTKGNLDDEDKKLLDSALYETRMQYVQLSRRVADM